MYKLKHIHSIKGIQDKTSAVLIIFELLIFDLLIFDYFLQLMSAGLA